MFEPVMQFNISSNCPSDFRSNDDHDNGRKFISKDCVHIINEEKHTRSNYFNFDEDMDCIEECSSLSFISYSESECSEREFKNNGLRSTKEKLTRDWVKRMFAENEEDSSIDSCFKNISFSPDKELLYTSMCRDDEEKSFYSKFFFNSKSDEDADMSEQEVQVDESVVFAEEQTRDIECSLDSTISFLQVVTEENCKNGLSFSTRGSLSCYVDVDELSEEEDDIEFMFSSSSLSSEVLPGLYDQNDGSLSQGFVNKAYDDFFDFKKMSKVLQDINDKWNNSMEDIEDKPREPLKVSFAPSEELVTVHSFEKNSEESLLNISTLDQLRFKQRIKDFNAQLSPFLTSEHRAKIVYRNNI